MLRTLLFVALFAAAFSLKLKSCKNGGKASVHSVTLNPDPVKLSAGKLTVGFHAQLHQSVAHKLEAEITIKKKIGFIWTKVPCSKIGGCKYDICAELAKQTHADLRCPIEPRELKIDGIEVPIPELSGAVKSLITGKVWAKVEIKENGSVIACNEIELEIKK